MDLDFIFYDGFWMKANKYNLGGGMRLVGDMRKKIQKKEETPRSRDAVA